MNQKVQSGFQATGIPFIDDLFNTPPVRVELGSINEVRTNTDFEFHSRAAPYLECEDIEYTYSVQAGLKCLEVQSRLKRSKGRILYFFGGGFVTGSLLQDMPIVVPLAQMTGMSIIIPFYRLAPEHPWPSAIDDAARSLLALEANCGDEPIAIMGESAGGNLALNTTLNAAASHHSKLAACVLLSPWCDLTDFRRKHDAHVRPDPTIDHELLVQFRDAYAQGQDFSRPDISPTYGNFGAHLPPTLITTGTRDELLFDCLELAKRMRDSGMNVEVNNVQDMLHVFELYYELPQARKSLEKIAAFITHHVNLQQQ